ncbi:PilZ domain-containing protein [Hahella ganghwensis]|uniref:PilZ domain-containing protein n=1 Tax=Hahella ganghwensis TaxID=286420 RepID=UPI00037D5077|nr:PilZ domain-containing protein [Hahella ganghwensis]
MEHRLDIRNRVNFTVKLGDVSQTLGTFEVLDISEGGIGLEDPEGKLPIGDFVEVIFPHSIYAYLDENADTSTLMPDDCFMQGLVIHTTNGRAGLMWDSGDDFCLRLLPELIAA